MKQRTSRANGSGWAVVTGASSGMGREFALALAERGYQVLAVARRDGRLKTLADDVSARGGMLEPLVADLSTTAGVAAVVARTTEIDVGLLVNNAGVAAYGPFASLPLEKQRDLVRVNVEAVVALTHALVPKMVERGSGGVINLASQMAFQPVPYFGAYAASKAFVLSFSEALAEELRGSGVRVTAVAPGFVNTEFTDVAGSRAPERRFPHLQPRQVVDSALRAHDRGRTVKVVGRLYAFLTFAGRFAPRAALRRMMGRAMRPTSREASPPERAEEAVFSRLANLINHHPWRVLTVVLVITAIAAPLGLDVRDHLKPRGFDVAGSGSAKARESIERATGTDPGNSILAVVRLPSPVESPRSRRTVAVVESKLRRDPAVAAVLDSSTAHNPAMISRDRRSTYLIAALRPLDDTQQEEAGKRLLTAFAGDPRVTLGGNPVANHEISKTIEDDLRRAELLGLPLIVLLSFFLFRGFVASLLAPIAGAITVLVSFFLLRELASVTSLSIYALNLVTGLSIGLSIDWSLLLLSRYREERATTPDLQLALRRALVGAGHTIFFSALTVAASLAALLVFPLRFLRSMGYGGIVASAVAMLAALVVLPTVLRLLGPHVDALALPRWRDPKRLAEPSRFWRKLGVLTTGRAIPVVTMVVVLLLLVATPILRVQWTTVDANSLPASAQAFQADRAINHSREFVPNSGIPFYIVLKAPPTAVSAAATLAGKVRQLEGVLAVAPPRPLRNNTWQIDLIATDRPYSRTTQTLVDELASLASPYPILVGGDAASFHDERDAISSHLPIAIALLAIATLLILFLLTGSLVAPALSLLMNALTLAAAFGTLILIFQDGRFEGLLAYTSQGALDLTIPLVLAALVFAISTDYGVFLLSRVREAKQHGQTDREAISSSVATVGRIVTSAAILFAVSIGVFGTSNIIVLKILGVGTAAAVLADAVLVRSLLLPAALALLGPRAWWSPASLTRLQRKMGPA